MQYTLTEEQHEAVKAAWLRAGKKGARVGLIQRGYSWELRGHAPDGEYVSHLGNSQNTVEYLDSLAPKREVNP